MEYTLNCNGKLLALSAPQVMGILNATPDSFYAGSRSQTEQEIAERTHQILDEGATIIDVGACSTRPDSEPATEEEEMVRLRMALAIVRREAPDAIISVDTYRPDVARMVVEEFGADIINDVGGPVTSHFSPQDGGRQLPGDERAGAHADAAPAHTGGHLQKINDIQILRIIS